jgi:hypothetical protein
MITCCFETEDPLVCNPTIIDNKHHSCAVADGHIVSTFLVFQTVEWTDVVSMSMPKRPDAAHAQPAPSNLRFPGGGNGVKATLQG